MSLETQVREQLEQQFNKHISIVEQQGPKHYHGTYTGQGIISTPVMIDQEKENWKLQESLVYNYLVTFKEVGGVVPHTLKRKDLYKLIPVM